MNFGVLPCMCKEGSWLLFLCYTSWVIALVFDQFEDNLSYNLVEDEYILAIKSSSPIEYELHLGGSYWIMTCALVTNEYV